MKTLSDSERALLDDVKETFGKEKEALADEFEGILNGSLKRFTVANPTEEEVIRALAAVHGVELPC